MSRHDGLGPLARGKIAAKHDAFDAVRSLRRLLRNVERKRRAGIPMPDFDGIDPVPMRSLAAGKEKIDRG